MTSESTFSDSVAERPSATERPSSPEAPRQTDAKQAETAALPQRPLPDLSSGYVLHGHAPGDVLVIVAQEALQQVRGHSISNLRAEVGGTLLGSAFRHGQQIVVQIKAALPARNDDHGPVHFKFTADAWRQLNHDRETQYADLNVVGWFHTHPGLGVFYSGDDVVVHSTSFTLPWQVGLVVDPIRNEACFFGWRDGALAPFAGYYEALTMQPEPAAPWRMVKTAVWQISEEAAIAAHRLPATAPATAPVRGAQRFTNRVPAWGWLAGAVIGVLAFFFLAGWAATLNRQVNVLETAVLSLSAGSQAAAVCPDPNVRVLSPQTAGRAPAGETVRLIGTADVPGAARYLIQVRPQGTTEWTTADVRRRATALGQLGAWKTADYAPGAYELRVTAVDRNNIRLNSATPCQIEFELIP